MLLAHDGSNRVFPEIGVAEGHHSLSHHRDDPDMIRKVELIDRFYATQFANFLGQLESKKDLEKALASARAHLADKDAALDAARRTLALADNQRDQLINGAGDPAYIEALATIAAADAKDDLATLYAEARRTPTRADETIVGRIEAIDKQIASADSELQGLRETARSLAKRRTDVERTRERFQRSGYDHPNATFGNERVIAEVLGGILTGALKGSVLWDTLRGGYSSQPPRSRPDFGGGFPFPLPGPWNQENESGNVWGDGWRNPGSAGPWAPHSGDDNDGFSTGGQF
jgi:hypothetical protein